MSKKIGKYFQNFSKISQIYTLKYIYFPKNISQVFLILKNDKFCWYKIHSREDGTFTCTILQTRLFILRTSTWIWGLTPPSNMEIDSGSMRK
jgi:hypothetical protein